jgi:hypothetical protein
MRLSSNSGILVPNLIAHGGSSDIIPFMNPMSSKGFVGSSVSWKAHMVKSELMNTDLRGSK